ncbi:DNRLRE domain-containing protein, partial [bacterium]|nr:DNRLRE domain-containing protein [bacterium]
VVFDDTGSEWTRQGERFTFRHFPNRFVHSRESGAKTAPYFTVYLGEKDDEPPAAPSGIQTEKTVLPAGEAIVSWDAPPGAIGFMVTVDGKSAPRYLIPMATAKRVRMHLRDMPLSGTVTVTIRAVDGAGNVGPEATGAVRVSQTPRTVALPGEAARPFTEAAPLPKLGDSDVCVVDALDKMTADGSFIPARKPAYLAANHLWSAKEKRVRLYAAKNEFVAFQLIVRGGAKGLTVDVSAGPARAEALAFRTVQSKKGALPDPLVPLGTGSVSAVLVDVYVPHDAPAGAHKGAVTLKTGGETLTLTLDLHVWDFTLPDFLSFVPEMNSYGIPGPPLERGYYRVAHAHRACLNVLPYSQGGSVRAAPKWDGKTLDWTAWDARFGPLLDGSAFADLPRKSVPVDAFYLPIHENWPTPIDPNYNGSYWADRAFPPAYRKTFVDVSRMFAEHFDRKGWRDTWAQFYLNNKNNFKQRGWSRGSSPWILDEPASFQDFWALRWFATAFHEGAAPAKGDAMVGYRIDISRPQWERDSQKDLTDFYICGGTFRTYRRMILDRQRENGMVVIEYGSSNAIEDSNIQPAGWCVSAWALGADGVLPWQTIGNSGSWTRADPLSMFYPGAQVGSQAPVPSVRLKAYRRGQQDVEYLALLTRQLGVPRWAVGRAAQDALRLTASARKGPNVGGIEDAGLITFRALMPEALWALRTRIGSALSKAKPAPKRRLVDVRFPVRTPAPLESFYPSPRPPVAEKAAAAAKPTKGIVIQGRPAVTDALIHFERPDKNFGSVPRDNRLRKAERSNAFLVKFDLPRGIKVAEAKLHFYVWDPSSKGNADVRAYRVTSSNWDERTVTWRHAAQGRPWKGTGGFEIGADTLAQEDGKVVVPPDQGRDTANPPLEYTVDVTRSVGAWAAGKAKPFGLALVVVSNRAVDEGNHIRIQILGSEYGQKPFTPKLTIQSEE